MIVEDDDDEEEEEDITEVVEPVPRGKGKSKASASPATNGKPPFKAKGKGRAASTTSGHKSGSDLVVIEELDDDEPPVAKLPPPIKKGKPRAGSPVSVEEGEIAGEITSSRGSERMREERDLVRPLASRFKRCKTNDLCHAV